MVCKQCGAYCESNMQYCAVCGALLSDQSTANRQSSVGSAAQPPAEELQSVETERPGWGFVRSPRWPKPSFDINTVEDIPEVQAPDAPVFDGSPQESAEYIEPSYDAPAYEKSAYHASEYNEPDYEQPPVPRYRTTAPASRLNPQPLQAQQRPNPKEPIASVGGYESGSAGYLGSFGRAPQHAAVYNTDDEDVSYSPPARKRTAPPAMSQTAPMKKQMPVSKSRGGASSFHSGRRKNMLFWGAVGVLVVLLIVFGAILINRNYGGIGGFFRNVFGGSPILKDPVVTEGLNGDGVDCYIITVYAREGNTITMRVGDDERSDVIGSSNQKILRIPKASFLPEEPVDGATADLVPDVRVTTEDGEVFQLEIPPIPVQVPALTVTLSEPATSSISVNKSKVTFAGKVDDGTVGVFVEGQPLSVNADGTFSGEYPLTELGVFNVTLEARKNGYQIFRQAFNVDYTQAEANIELDKSTLRASASDTATVKGTTDPGATLSVTGPGGVTLGTPNINAATGIFSFTAQMAEVGHYDLEVTVTKDGLSTTGTITVERAPDYAAYTAAVHKMDYSRMKNETLHKAAYKCVGKVAEIVQTDPYIIAKLTTDSGDLLFAYHNTAATVEASDGKTYNVFGDYAGIDETTGLPMIYGWFITKK